jgi:hypothetical protein
MADDAAADSGDVLSTFGTVHIWLSLILLPVAIICLVVAMILEANWQKGWKTGTATCKTTTTACTLTDRSLPYHCPVQVTVDTLGSHVYSMTYTTDTPSVEAGATWKVAYDEKDVQGTLTQNVSTWSSRTTTIAILGVIAGFMVLFFVLNLVFRKNKTFKKISGVMEIADIANSVGGAFR